MTDLLVLNLIFMRAMCSIGANPHHRESAAILSARGQGPMQMWRFGGNAPRQTPVLSMSITMFQPDNAINDRCDLLCVVLKTACQLHGEQQKNGIADVAHRLAVSPMRLCHTDVHDQYVFHNPYDISWIKLVNFASRGYSQDNRISFPWR